MTRQTQMRAKYGLIPQRQLICIKAYQEVRESVPSILLDSRPVSATKPAQPAVLA